MAGLLGAITWNLITWYFGLPSSSSHALIGGLVGAAVAAGARPSTGSTVHRQGRDPDGRSRRCSPSALGFVVMLAIMWVFRRANPHKASRGFRMAQTVSAAAMALGHGLQDAQKTMGVIFLALLTGGFVSAGDDLPLWVIFVSAAAISLGTYSGGWRIMRTLGRRIIAPRPGPRLRRRVGRRRRCSTPRRSSTRRPISTTHTITSAVMGVGATKRLSAVRWGVARSILIAWVLTFPMAGLAAAGFYWVCHFLLEVVA